MTKTNASSQSHRKSKDEGIDRRMKKSAFYYLFRLFSEAKKYWYLIIISIVLSIFYSALYQGRVYLAKPLFDVAILQTDWEKMFSIVIFAALLAIPIGLFDFLRNYIQKFVMLRVIIDLRTKVCSHLLRLSLKYLYNKKQGDVISRLTNDVGMTQNMLELLFEDVFLQPFMIIAALITAFVLSPILTVISLCIVPPVVLLTVFFGRKIRKLRKKTLVKLASVTESIHQMLSGIRIVKAYNKEDAEIESLEKHNEGFLKKSLKIVKIKSLIGGIMELVYALALVIPFLVGGYLILGLKVKGITYGELIGVMLAMIAMVKPSRALIKGYTNIQEGASACERIYEILDVKPEIYDEKDAISVHKVDREIKFCNSYFSYDNEPVLKDVNLKIKKGEVVALVGPSGAGKSTLLDLIIRFYDPTQGAIFIDDTDIRKIKKESLLLLIAVVTQDPFLFNTTIEENIRYGKPDATQEEIESAAKNAYIHDFIMTLEDGYKTVVGERGVKLSGGEKQRISIARAFLKNAPILLLDEATSSLDSESEQQVHRALENLMKGKTAIIIAHRLSTVQHADRIVVLDKGEIVEQGTHQELISQNGLYKRLYEMQKF